MIQSLILITLLTQIGGISETEAIEISNGFRLVAAKAGGEYFIGPVPIAEPYRVASSDGGQHWDVWYSDGFTTVRKSDGKVVLFSLRGLGEVSTEWSSSGAMSAAETMSKVAMFYNEAGFSRTLLQVSIRPEIAENSLYGNTFLTVALPQASNGVWYAIESWVVAIVEHTTGRLAYLEIGPRPSLPTQLNPGISANDAIQATVGYLFSKTGHTVYNFELPPTLSVWCPRHESVTPSLDELRSTYDQQAATNAGILVYSTMVSSPNHANYYGNPTSFDVYINAVTGEPLGAAQHFPLGETKPAVRPFRWDLGVGELQVATDNIRISVPDGDVATAAKRRSGENAIPVWLTRARWTVRANYEPATGLLFVEVSGKRIYGQPNQSLKRALDQLVTGNRR